MPRQLRTLVLPPLVVAATLLAGGCGQSGGHVATGFGQQAQTADLSDTCQTLDDKFLGSWLRLNADGNRLDMMASDLGQVQSALEAAAASANGKAADDFRSLAEDYGRWKAAIQSGNYDGGDYGEAESVVQPKLSQDGGVIAADCSMPDFQTGDHWAY